MCGACRRRRIRQPPGGGVGPKPRRLPSYPAAMKCIEDTRRVFSYRRRKISLPIRPFGRHRAQDPAQAVTCAAEPLPFQGNSTLGLWFTMARQALAFAAQSFAPPSAGSKTTRRKRKQGRPHAVHLRSPQKWPHPPFGHNESAIRLDGACWQSAFPLERVTGIGPA